MVLSKFAITIHQFSFLILYRLETSTSLDQTLNVPILVRNEPSVFQVTFAKVLQRFSETTQPSKGFMLLICWFVYVFHQLTSCLEYCSNRFYVEDYILFQCCSVPTKYILIKRTIHTCVSLLCVLVLTFFND